MNSTIRHAAFAAASIATAVTLAACGGTTSDGGNPNMPGMPGMTGPTGSTSKATSPASSANPAAGPHNAADIAFATEMIPHHGQAVTMAEMAIGKATNPDVSRLAAAIQSAQGPEITLMSGWLTDWGQPVPSATSGMGGMAGMAGMGTSGDTSGMAGMMSEQEMQQLSAATGPQFDRMWLQMMITHHQGAVTMAQTEISAGQNADAKQLAGQIIDAQTKEIASMHALVSTITG